MKAKRRIKKIFSKALPLWMVLMLFIQSTMIIGVVEYFLVIRYVNAELAKIKSPEEIAKILKQQVHPQSGYVLAVTWGDIGKELLTTGAIDQEKYNQLFANDPGDSNMMQYMQHSSHENMMINEADSHFMVDTLWALGLVNKNKILDEGQIQKNGEAMNYASTGGWNLGSKETSELFSSQPLIQLSDNQQALVQKIAEHVFRPCCSNPTSFPDCNHGMAVLGYIEMAVKQGIPEKQIYQDILALNSYWFPRQYVDIATYFYQQKTDWHNVDAKLALSEQYSSGQGLQQVEEEVHPDQDLNSHGGGCSA